MAIQIIGGSHTPEAEPSPLPNVDANLPPPTTARAGAPVLDDEKLRALLDHESPVLRSYGIEQASKRPDDAWSQAIQAKILDSSPVVAADAIQAIENRKYLPALDAIAERFKSGEGEVVAAAARALGVLAPERLLELIKQRGRLDDGAYAVTAAAIATLGTPEVVEYLDRALNRAGALSPDRRSALYAAALRSGNAALAGRVIGLAIEDSKQESPEGSIFPSRAALLVIAGIMTELADPKAGPRLFDVVQELATELVDHLDESQRAPIESAVKAKNARAIVAALEPLLALPDPAQATAASTAAFTRRRGLLKALIERKEDIGALPFAPAVIFVTAAVEAAIAVAVGGTSEAKSPAVLALTKALEMNIEPSALVAKSDEELAALFLDKTERQMRRVHNIVTHEQTNRVDTLERFTRAIVDAGHAVGLFEAAADVPNERLHDLVIAAIERKPDVLEAIVVDALTRTPLEPKLTAIALRAVPAVRTQRVSLSLGRRFYDLRKVARDAVVGATLRLGDTHLLGLIESRAFRDEPEEITAAVLRALDSGSAGQLDALLSRRSSEEEAPVVLPLKCKRCEESLLYRFERVLIDLESKEPNGDPAFVGDTTCKACKAEDTLELGPEGAELLTREMLTLLAAARSGRQIPTPAVMPAQMRFRGKPMGYAAALRALDKEIKESPTAIRPRLERAEMRLILRRPRSEEDVDAALAIDPRALEAQVLALAVALRDNEMDLAKERAIAAFRGLSDASRVYLAESVEPVKKQLEDLAYDCVLSGQTFPEDIDLSGAHARFEARMAAAREAQAERESQAAIEEGSAAAPSRGPAPESEFKDVGRNDECPCGSGKKFKKCHGRAR